MKSMIKTKSLQLLGSGIFASAILTVSPLYAADQSMDSSTTPPPTQGSGAASLSGNSENGDATSSDRMNRSENGSMQNESRDSMHEHSRQDKMSRSTDAKSFVREAIAGNSAEIALAEVAGRKAQNSDVKQLAEMIRKDHQQANEKLKPIAEAQGLTINQPLDSKHQKKLESFQKMSGAEFDREYVTDMLKDHQKDIGKYEKAVDNLKESDVQQYAQNTLPTLRQHLQHAEHAARSIGIDQATITSILSKSNAMGGTSDETDKATGTEKSDWNKSDTHDDMH